MLLIKSAALALGSALLLPVGLDKLDETPAPTPGHCQIPCGIYDDPARFNELAEHITTIEKSMKQIVELGKEPGANANQLTRWVVNKEHHADDFVAILTKYFLQQRLKPAEAESDAEAYQAKLAAVHALMVHAMKAKQTTDLAHIEALRNKLDEFQKLYNAEG